MKKAYKKLRMIDKLIFECEISLENIENWALHESEKQAHRYKYKHWLGELFESRKNALYALKDALGIEMRITNEKIKQHEGN